MISKASKKTSMALKLNLSELLDHKLNHDTLKELNTHSITKCMQNYLTGENMK